MTICGDRFGRLFVLNVISGNKNNNYQKTIKVRCDCGTVKMVAWNSLRDGLAQSCGCLHLERVTKHGEDPHSRSKGKRSPEYRVWEGIKQRCLNNRCPSWNDYGGRGITICEEWKSSYTTFRNYLLKTIGRRPSFEHSIDRIDNNGNYEPGNIRWATKSQQAINRRLKHYYAGKTIIRDK